jgi:hypothetical protein
MRNPTPPKYYRGLQLVLSDKDAALKQWCWDNPDRMGAVVRAAMYDYLIRTGELQSVDARGVSVPAPNPAQPSQPSAAAPSPPLPLATAVPVAAPVVVAAAATAPEQTSVASTTDAGTGTATSVVPGKVPDAAKAKIKHLIAGNSNFA